MVMLVNLLDSCMTTTALTISMELFKFLPWFVSRTLRSVLCLWQHFLRKPWAIPNSSQGSRWRSPLQSSRRRVLLYAFPTNCTANVAKPVMSAKSFRAFLSSVAHTDWGACKNGIHETVIQTVNMAVQESNCKCTLQLNFWVCSFLTPEEALMLFFPLQYRCREKDWEDFAYMDCDFGFTCL